MAQVSSGARERAIASFPGNACEQQKAEKEDANEGRSRKAEKQCRDSHVRESMCLTIELRGGVAGRRVPSNEVLGLAARIGINESMSLSHSFRQRKA
jgi:hypothetical protein